MRGNKVTWFRDHQNECLSLTHYTAVEDPHHHRLLNAWTDTRNNRIRTMLSNALKAEGFKRKTPDPRVSCPTLDDFWQAPES